MATVLGNLALPVDLTSPALIAVGISDHRKTIRLLPFDVLLSLNLPRREKEFLEGGGGENRNFATERGSVKVKFAKKRNAVEFDASSNEEDNGYGEDDDEEEFDWETEMRKRVKEIEEMRELEKKAEELTGRVYGEERESSGDSGGGGDGEESEEEKKMRVRKELEKVDFSFFLAILILTSFEL